MVNENKVREFFKSYGSDIMCPFDCFRLAYSVNSILFSDNISPIDFVEMMVYHNLIKTQSSIDFSELHNKLNFFKEQFFAAKQEADEANKKLLIAVGAAHTTNDSFFMEMFILTFLKQQEVNTLLVELSKDMLDDNIQGDNPKLGFSVYLFAMNILKMDLKAVDPYSKSTYLMSEEFRGEMMHEAIQEEADATSVAITGVMHLEHIIGSGEIQDDFIVLPVNVVDKAFYDLRNLQLIEFTNKYADVSYLDMTLSKSLSPFSVVQLVEFYLDFQAGDRDSVHHSEFDHILQTCDGFADVNMAAEVLGNAFNSTQVLS